MKILNSYLLKTLFNYFLIVSLAWVIIFVFFDLIVEIKDVGKNDYSFFDILYIELLKIPTIIYQGLIVIILISTVLALSSMTQNSEMIVMLSSGKSIFSIVKNSCLYSLFFMIIVVLIVEIYGINMHKQAENYKSSIMQNINNKQNIWLKQDNYIINIKDNYDGKSFSNLSLFKIKHNKLEIIINAKYGLIKNNKLVLNNVIEKSFKLDNLYQKEYDEYILSIDFNNKIINNSTNKKKYLSSFDLYKHGQFLEKNQIVDNSFKVELITRMIKPIILLITIIFTSLFIFGSSMRDSSLGKKLFLAITVSLFFELILRISSALSLKFSYNYTIGSIIIIFILFFIMLGLLVKKSNE